MRKQIAIVGATEEALQLVPLLEANPELELVALFDPDLESARLRLAALPPDQAAALEGKLTDDPAFLDAAPRLFAVIDAEGTSAVSDRLPRLAEQNVQVVTPLTARLLFGYGASARDRKSELLQALHEVVESVDLTVDTGVLFSRMLEVAVGVTGAEGGSLMLLDPDAKVLSVRCAIGVEPELWPKIRVALGDGIAGRAAAEGRPIWLRGKADREDFQIVRERFDVESALCVPLMHQQRLLGVLNLHHSQRPDAFSDEDLEFVEELGRLDAEIIARAQEHQTLRSSAARYQAVQAVRETLSGSAPLLERLRDLCRRVAKRAGDGIVTLYLHDPDEGELRLAATSLAGGGFAGEYRFVPGQGIDGRVARERRPAFLRGSDGSLEYAALPLLDGDQLVGVLSVQLGPGGAPPIEGPGPHDPAFEEVLREVAAAAADEISGAEREARVAACATQMNAINEIGIRMISCHDTGELVRLATSSAALILAADHAVLRLQDASTRRYVIRSYYGSADGRLQEKLFRLDKRVSVEVIKSSTARLTRELDREPSYRECDTGVRSLMPSPLKQEHRVIGTLCLYDKVAADRFYAGTFGDEDLRVFSKLVSYVETALENARFHAKARAQRSFDDETGLPNANYLEKRIEQEVARAAGRSGALAVALCRLENLEEIGKAIHPSRAERVLQRTAQAFQRQMRDFDVLARTASDEFTVLLPDPGPAPSERIYALARAVADEIGKDESLNEPVRVSLAFGYALYPLEGIDCAALLERASEARIRML
jgi:diguanylate cyclase (GGDEF)-like protein